MLLGYGAKNCWCFKDWMQVNLELDGSVPSEGANASGKTNGLKVLAFIKHFAEFSFQTKPDERIFVDSFFFNDEPSEFYIEFIWNNVFYRYELEITTKAVVSERLFRKKAEEGSRETEIFVREGNTVKKNTLYKGHTDILFRNNASFICTLNQYGLPEIKDIFDFFYHTVANVVYTGLSDLKAKDPFGATLFYQTQGIALSGFLSQYRKRKKNAPIVRCGIQRYKNALWHTDELLFSTCNGRRFDS